MTDLTELAKRVEGADGPDLGAPIRIGSRQGCILWNMTMFGGVWDMEKPGGTAASFRCNAETGQILAGLERRGLVRLTRHHHSPHRRRYQITLEGHRAAAQWRAAQNESFANRLRRNQALAEEADRNFCAGADALKEYIIAQLGAWSEMTGAASVLSEWLKDLDVQGVLRVRAMQEAGNG